MRQTKTSQSLPFCLVGERSTETFGERSVEPRSRRSLPHLPHLPYLPLFLLRSFPQGLQIIHRSFEFCFRVVIDAHLRRSKGAAKHRCGGAKRDERIANGRGAENWLHEVNLASVGMGGRL